MKLSSFIPAIGWFCISAFLLCLPGHELPQAKFLDIPFLDKWVHLGIFFLISYLFSRPFKSSPLSVEKKRSWFLSIALYALAYGIAMEFVQKYFVPNRSYDVWDIVVDGLGSFAGYLWSVKFLLRDRKLV